MEPENTSKKRKFRTAVQRAEIVDLFQRSSLTRSAFAQSYNIPISTLSKWLTTAKRVSKSPVLFRELRLPVDPSSAEQWAMEVVHPDGLMVRCREPLDVQDLAWLLRSR